MPGRTRITIAKPDIVRLFQDSPTRIYARADIARILADNRSFWRLAQSTTTDKFIDFLVKRADLQIAEMGFPARTVTRYTWGEVSIHELVQSLAPEGYFTHYTAMHLHGLTVQIPKTIYFNVEQRASGSGGDLSQPRIDQAFARQCRVSQNVATYGDHKICLLNGRNTGALGVIQHDSPPSASHLRVTDVERTLIDATVRPVYSGGVFEVLRAFEAARDRLSVNKLVAILRKLDYTYPYHQAIGFYLERAGYRESQIELLRRFDMSFDFYLTYQMRDPDYDAKWRLFVPKGF